MLSALNETTMKTEMSMVVAMMLMSIVSIPGRAVKSSILQQLQTVDLIMRPDARC